eukprot:scaffold3437_cov113-Cylindrotheca_fusiformis.AAC.31
MGTSKSLHQDSQVFPIATQQLGVWSDNDGPFHVVNTTPTTSPARHQHLSQLPKRREFLLGFQRKGWASGLSDQIVWITSLPISPLYRERIVSEKAARKRDCADLCCNLGSKEERLC